MKNRHLFFGLILISSLLNYSCDSDPCDEGYTQVEQNGSFICLPDFLAGIEKSNEYGNTFYHKKHGVITFEKGQWTNEFGEKLTDL